MNKKIAAATLFTQWRAEGIPDLITMHEAFRLTDGKIGTEGDHSTPINLSTVARRMVEKF